MKEWLALLANLAGFLGMAVCLLSALARLFSRFTVGGFEALTLFQIGIGLMVSACFLKLYLKDRAG